MRFTPLTDQQIQEIGILQPGQYSFEVVDAEESISKSNNEMIKLKIKIWDSSGKERIIFDYLLEKMAYKLVHFTKSVNLFNKYESGELTANDCKNKLGILELDIDNGSPKGDGTFYPKKNIVKDYIVDKNPLPKNAKVIESIDTFKDDEDIPF